MINGMILDIFIYFPSATNYQEGEISGFNLMGPYRPGWGEIFIEIFADK
mgnify:CR=1 FL=1